MGQITLESGTFQLSISHCRCWKVHDKCYDNIVKKKYCGSLSVAKVYLTTYLLKLGSCTRCGK